MLTVSLLARLFSRLAIPHQPDLRNRDIDFAAEEWPSVADRKILIKEK